MKIPVIGELWAKLIDTAGAVIQEVVPDKDLAKKLDHDFRTQVEAQAETLNLKEIDAELEMFRAQQATIQVELQQSDLYTKRTRPLIARRSFYAGLAYVLLTSLPEKGLTLPLLGTMMPWQFQWEILLLLYSPALTYMGVRTFDKWRDKRS